MDSCNSGSLQSSSGGDEEFDSRAAAAADSFSAFINTQQPHNAGPISNPPPPLFDPLLSNYFQLQQNQNMPWPRPTTLRSDPNQNPMLYQQTFLPSFQSPPPPDNNVNNNSNLTDVPPPPQNQNQAAARNPKKRSRASRRAPTTVLTTDTTNFRAMVQEFTGIPAPPFNNSSLFPRNRLDLFGNITRSTSFDAAAPPPYLRRPLPQKVQSPPPPQPAFLGSSLNAPLASSNINNNNTVVTNSVSSTTSTSSVSISNADFSNYQIPITQNSNVFNFPNPFIASLLQNNSKFPFSNSSHHHVSSFGNIPLNDNHLNEFGLGHHENRVNPTLPNLISSDQIAPRNNHNNNSNAANEGDRDGEAQIRSGNENNYNFLRNIMSDGKIMNFEGSDQKRQESNTRGDQAGTVESWICSSSD